MYILLEILYWVIHACSILILIRAILSWVHPAANRWTVLLQRVTEPLLAPIRKLLNRLFPQGSRVIDFSPMVVILLLELAGNLVQRLMLRALLR